MVVQVSIERAVWKRGLAQEAFGGQAFVLTAAYDALYEQVWTLAARVFTKEQRVALDNAIQAWLVEHPERRYAGLVRFDALAKYRTEPLRDLGEPRGLGLLAPVSEAARTAEALRLLAERALFLGQRLPMLLNWQGQQFYFDILDDPETRELLRNASELSAAANSMSKVVEEKMPNPKDMSGLLGDVRAVEGEANALVRETTIMLTTLDHTVGSVDRLLDRLVKSKDDGGPPRDATKNGDAVGVIQELRGAVSELNTLLTNLDALAASPDVTARLGQVDVAVVEVRKVGEQWIDRLFWRGLLLLGATFALLFAYRVFSRALAHR
jgi:hypothetical protein